MRAASQDLCRDWPLGSGRLHDVGGGRFVGLRLTTPVDAFSVGPESFHVAAAV